MRKRALLISILAGILVVSAVVVLAGNSTVNSAAEVKSESITKTLTSHAPIYIDGNAGFTKPDPVNGGGTGTSSDPYIIENWDINANSATGVEIRNTDKYFIIRNCVIHDGKSNDKYGIYFYIIQTGKIDNVISYNNYCGIYLYYNSYYSNSNYITNCTVYSNYYGIWLDHSSNNNITNCAVYNNSYGIKLDWASKNIITNCYVYNNSIGISLTVGQKNYITNCTVYNNDYGIYLSHSDLCYPSYNTITNCTVYNNDYGIYLDWYSYHNTLTNCAVHDNSYGIYLYGCYDGYSGCDYNQITNCYVYNNSECGIYLYYSSNNEIHYCYIYNNNGYGVYIDKAHQVSATYNWWGSPDGPGGVGPGSGDNVSSLVTYNPWWTIKAFLKASISYPNVYNYSRVNWAIEFNASSSYTDQGIIKEYYFDFGDGNTTGWINASIISHSYSTPGKYNGIVKVKNDYGWVSFWCSPVNITVFTNIPPFAVLQQVSSNYTYANISISGYSSFDFDGNVTQYYFDFVDNNTGWISTPNITRQYPDSGYHTVRLKVKDNESCESNWTNNITFYVRNRPPTAIISANPVVVEIGLPITFDGTASSDLDGNVTEYYFDFGDKSDSGWTTDYSKSHLYMTSGVYNATLRVKDDDGSVSSIAYIMIIVGQPSTPDNQLPVADAGSDATVYIGEPVLFNGTTTDPDGFIIYYQWDFDGDGNYDWNSTKTGFTVYTYTKEGIYTAKFRAYDNQGGFSTDTRIVIVKSKGPVQTVSPSGGIVEYNNTTISIPSGAIVENVTFTVTETSIPQPSGYVIIGNVYKIEATITAFAQPITITLRYNESDLPENASEDNLSIYKKVGNDWIKLDSTVDKVNNTVSALVTSLSEFTILYKLPGAEIEPTGIQPAIQMYLIIVVIITILIIIAAVMIRKRKVAVAEVEKPEVELPPTQLPTLTFRCPQCKTTFQAESKEKPFKIKCPSCGTEGVIR